MRDDPYRNTAAVYDYLIEPFLKPIRRLTVRALKKNTGGSKPRRILEIACGTGSQSRHIAAEGFKVFALDRSAGMIQASRKKNTGAATAGVRLIRADATRLPFSDACFDAVVVQFTLHEMGEPALSQSLQEISRVASAGALFYLVDFVPCLSLTFSKIILNVVERLAGIKHYRNGRQFLTSGGLPSVLYRMNLKPLSLHGFFEGNVYLAVACRRTAT